MQTELSKGKTCLRVYPWVLMDLVSSESGLPHTEWSKGTSGALRLIRSFRHLVRAIRIGDASRLGVDNSLTEKE